MGWGGVGPSIAGATTERGLNPLRDTVIPVRMSIGSNTSQTKFGIGIMAVVVGGH